MEQFRIVLIGGGVRSGKSSFAVELAQTLGHNRTFIATARPSDAEMAMRIERHKRDRQGLFATIEEPVALADALTNIQNSDVVVVDCLTLWLSNLLLRNDSADVILAQVDDVVRVLKGRRFHAVLVTNEVGMSVHPTTALSRAFVEIAGWTHQRFARAADEIYLAVLGTMTRVWPVSESGVSR